MQLLILAILVITINYEDKIVLCIGRVTWIKSIISIEGVSSPYLGSDNRGNAEVELWK